MSLPLAEHPLRTLFTASRFRLLLVMGAVFLAISTLTRLVLLGFHPAWLWRLPIDVGEGLAVGLVFDLIAAGWLLLPHALYLTLLPERWFTGPWQRRLIAVVTGAVLFGWLFVEVAELFFFAEFDGRFNFVAADYLIYPTEVSENIWQSYPTGWILAGIAVVTLLTVRWLRGPFTAAWSQPARRRVRFAGLAIYGGILALLTATVGPALARVSEDRALNEVAGNGYYSFMQAVLGADAPYVGLYATLEPAAITARLERLLAPTPEAPLHLAAGSTLRRVESPGPPRRLNVVVVLEESLGSELVGVFYPRPKSLTPELDRLTAEGTLLTQAYSTGNRTIRAIEATTSSLPPLPGASIVRRTQSVDLFTLPSVLASEGYLTSFIYGGRALFDGMGSYLAANGVQRIVDQGEMPDGAFTTAWGVADEVIFDRALVEMDAMAATGKPFYSLVLSVSNHRPYTFPQDGIQRDPALKGRENAVRYADYALGRFMRLAASHAFYQDTLFVLMGDHGARVYGAAEIPLGSYEVPILFIGPGIAPGGRIDTLASALDLPPTILARLGLSYDSKFFGHDVFTVPPEAGRALVTHNNVIALLRGERIAVLGLHGATDLFSYSRRERTLEHIEKPDAAGEEQLSDAIAYFAGADFAYRNGLYQALPPPPASPVGNTGG